MTTYYTVVVAAGCDGGTQIARIEDGEDCCAAARRHGGICHHGAAEGGGGAPLEECQVAAAAQAIRAAGYDISRRSDDERIILAVSDEDGDATLAEIRAMVAPFGCTAEWTGDSDTDEVGYTTSDIIVEVAR